MAVDESYVPSPCVRLCTLDDRDICVGCYRTLEEIKHWGAMDTDRRRAVLELAARRRPQRRGPEEPVRRPW